MTNGVRADTTAYLAAVDERLRKMARGRDVTLEEVVRGARGVFPTIAVERLRRLGMLDRFARDDESRHPPAPRYSPELHPLDFEWYFNRPSSEFIADMFGGTAGVLLLLGAPTVGTVLAQRGRRSTLVDRNPLVARRFPDAMRKIDFQVVDLDQPLAVRHPGAMTARPRLFGLGPKRYYLREEPFEAAFFDGPWYLLDTLRWLWQADHVTGREATIGFVLVPELLRPTARAERKDILAAADRLGSVEVIRDAVEYDTPVFEREAFAAEGVELARNWRTADLVIVRKEDHPMKWPFPAATTREDGWETFVLGEQVVKLRHTVSGETKFAIAEVPGCDGYILPSVSRRDRRRDAVDLWTSRNRVAAVGDREKVARVLRGITTYRGELVFPASSDPVVSALHEILEAELTRPLETRGEN